jgi:hypothetical protein
MAFDIPQACTLPSAEQPIRLREFDELLASTVRSTKRDSATHLTFRLRGDDDLEAVARDLTAREAECCSFFDFSIGVEAGEVVLGIGVPEQHASILDSLQARTGVTA